MKRYRAKKSSTPLLRVIGALCWTGCLAAWVVVLTQIAGQSAWVIDQVATLAPQLTLLGVIPLLLAVAGRRWICTTAIGLAVVMSLMLFVPGRAPSGGGDPGKIVTVLTMNTLGVNQTPERVVELIAWSNADVVVLVECSWRLWTLIQNDDRLAEQLPYGSGPAHPKEWSRVKLSKWPLRPIELEKDEHWDVMKWNYLFRRSHIVERPGGEFILGAFVVRSPRSSERWEEGNEQLEENCSVVREYLAPLGLPIVMGVDLNATPSSSRTDMLRKQAGLFRCKPWLLIRGTWPAQSPVWARVAIDDVVVSAGVRRTSWRTVERESGSDHVAVEVGLVLPADH